VVELTNRYPDTISSGRRIMTVSMLKMSWTVAAENASLKEAGLKSQIRPTRTLF